MARKAPNVLLVYPAFTGSSFWNYRATCEMVGAKYTAPPLGLITVAAMLPKDWTVRLVDLNVETLEDADLDWADLVMTGSMLPQQKAALTVLERCATEGIMTVAGGPDVTSSPHLYDAATFRVLGEAESVIDDFVAAYLDGADGGVFEAPKFQADVTKTPLPRYDLVTFKNYLGVSVQFSRGCPFTCEFCDIIELYGRKPRAKTIDQMLAELQQLYDLGYRGHVDFVDDNLIGNKKAVKAFLPYLVAWQKARRYPFEFTTEASLNLSDDPELLRLLAEAGFFAIFIGIESPDPDVLTATRKKQNTRRDIAQSVQEIYKYGIFVIGGFIVGFDNESDAVASEIAALVTESAIPVAMAGLLYALPTTQLTNRLKREGRLFGGYGVDHGDGKDDQCTTGLNFVTTRPREKILADYRALVAEIFTPAAYFARVRAVSRMLRTGFPNMSLTGGDTKTELKQMVLLLKGLTFDFPDYRKEVWKTIFACLLSDPRRLKPALRMMALFAHIGPFSRYVVGEIDQQIDDVRSGGWLQPQLEAAE